MFGKRCESCGEVRWSILGRDTEEQRCPCCGSVMVDERRRPGSREAAAGRKSERRVAPPVAPLRR